MSKDQKKRTEKSDETVKVIVPVKSEGWFCFQEVEIQKSLLDQGKVLSQTLPDIFPIYKEQVINKLREIYGI